MTIDWPAFTPYSSLAGGLLIGVAASMFLLLNGRIAGISGVLGSLIAFRNDGARLWRALFLAGLLVAPAAWSLFAALPAANISAGYGELIAAGLLVGIGTRYGTGCTSGHGVCGLSSLSLRSLVATLSFIAAGIVTVYVVRHALLAAGG